MDFMSLKKRLLDNLIRTDSYLSGQELADRFSVSRTAIWKAVNGLREEGYEIESTTNRGYRLKKRGERVRAHLLQVRTGLNTQWLNSVPSTNDYAKKLPLSALPALIVADEQTQGKARYGERFSSPAQGGVYFSLALSKKIPLEEIRPLSERVVKAVKERIGGEIQDNTVWQSGKKKAGVLTEVDCDTDFTERVVIGVGVYTEKSEDAATLILSLVGDIQQIL